MQEPIKQKAFSLSWENDSTHQMKKVDDFHSMRNWQISAFEALKNASQMILNAPTGSGKSWMMCVLSTFKMQQRLSLKTIISVPQTIIASGFLEAKIKMPTGEKIHWKIKHNLCEKGALSRGTVNYLIAWLTKTGVQSLDDRTIICTHSTLIHLYKKLKQMNQLFLLDDLVIWIDEAHHLKNIEAKNLGICNNGLGALVSYILNAQNSNVQLGLTTASFFRGDRCSLLTSSMESKFERFNLPYDQYFKTMKYLKSFSIDFLLCGPQYHKAIELLIKQRKAKDIIYIPHPVSGYSTGNKQQEVVHVLNAYGNLDQSASKIINFVDGIHGTYKILDLVNENLRKEKKVFLSDPLLKKNPDMLDVIIALGMFKEGADWIHADRSIIVGARSSLVDMIQMIGRLFRDTPGKEHVEIFQLLPFSLDQQNEEKFTENLNDYLKAIFASLILENIFNPVKIKMHQPSKNQKKLNNLTLDQDKTTWLSHLVPNETLQQTIMEDIANQLIEINAHNQEQFANVDILKDEYNKMIPQLLETKYGITQHAKDVATEVWNMFARRKIMMDGLSVEDITFELLQKTNPLDCLLRYTSGVCNIQTFEQFRAALQTNRPQQWRSFEDAREFVKNVGLKNWNAWIKWANSTKRPKNIPSSPTEIYKNEGWIDWGDFLGSNYLANQKRTYRSFSETKFFVQGLHLASESEWRVWKKDNKLPNDIPATPERVYSKEWQGWGNFLGTNRIANQDRRFKTFKETKTYAKNLGFKRKEDWISWAKSNERPYDTPADPVNVYSAEWQGWGDFLGTNRIANEDRRFKTFEDARAYAKDLGFERKKDWEKWAKSSERPIDIPAAPSLKYKNKGWISWHDWLSGK